MNFSKVKAALMGLGVISTGVTAFLCMDLHDPERNYKNIKSFMKKDNRWKSDSKYKFSDVLKNSEGLAEGIKGTSS